MKDKFLPIKIFEKRQDTDERLTEGGGNNQPPKWVLKGEPLQEKSLFLIRELQAAQKRIESKFKKHQNVPAVLTAKVSDDALAKSHLGFGIPSPANEILYNDPHEITLILRDCLDKGEYIDILDLPYPSSLTDEDGYYYGQVIVTVVNHPILEKEQGPEYCQSNIDVKLGTYDQKTQRDIRKRTVRNAIGREGTQNLLNSSRYSRKKPPEIRKQFFKTEKMLIQYGDKYYPNKKYALDLADLTESNKEKFLKAPKKWYLNITGVYRDFIEKKAEIERMGLSQDFCVVLTIRDPLRKAPVYDDVTRLLQANNFIHRDVKLRQDIRIRER